MCLEGLSIYSDSILEHHTFSALECVGLCGYIGVQSTAAEIPSLRLGDCRQTSGRIWQGKVVYKSTRAMDKTLPYIAHFPMLGMAINP